MIPLAKISVVLLAPQGPLNVGAIARVMMNFGFVDLRLVTPRCDHLSKEARDMAVTAASILTTAQVFPDLNSALADAKLVFGTTRRFGKYRQELITPAQIGRSCTALDSDDRLCLLFGREDKGLTTSELDHCHFFVTIPTDAGLPSLNIAQAVTVCLYELHQSVPPPMAADTQSPCDLPSSQNLETMYQHMRQTLTAIGFLCRENPDHILRAFRRIFNRAQLNKREVSILHGLWQQIAWLHREYTDRT